MDGLNATDEKMVEIIGMDIALIVVTISIMISGILLGLGRALSIKKIELFGFEELIQSVVNAALVGVIALIIESIETLSSDLITPSCSTSSLIAGVECNFSSLSSVLFSFSNELLKLSVMVGYYQSLILNFSVLEIQPFQNLASLSSVFSFQLLLSNILIILLNLNIQIISFFSTNSLSLLLPIGLVFRSFFTTRRLGGFLIALSIGAFLFYPAFISIFPVPLNSTNSSTLSMSALTNNSLYMTEPIVDLNDNNAVAQKLDSMSSPSTDFVGDLTVVQNSNSNTLSEILYYTVFTPLFSLLITIIFVKEFSDILGGNFSFSWRVV